MRPFKFALGGLGVEDKGAVGGSPLRCGNLPAKLAQKISGTDMTPPRQPSGAVTEIVEEAPSNAVGGLPEDKRRKELLRWPRTLWIFPLE